MFNVRGARDLTLILGPLATAGGGTTTGAGEGSFGTATGGGAGTAFCIVPTGTPIGVPITGSFGTATGATLIGTTGATLIGTTGVGAGTGTLTPMTGRVGGATCPGTAVGVPPTAAISGAIAAIWGTR